jgi:hypothetical protein
LKESEVLEGLDHADEAKALRERAYREERTEAKAHVRAFARAYCPWPDQLSFPTVRRHHFFRVAGNLRK